MTEQTNKRQNTIVTVLVILVILGIGLLTVVIIDYNNTKEKERLAEEQRKEAVGYIYSDVKREYELLKSIAPWWNEQFAKLTLNHTRDTVEHREYTVAEFVQFHRALSSNVNSIGRDDRFLNGFHISQLTGIFSPEYQSQNLIGTCRTKEQFFEDMQELDRLYYYILSKTKGTDMVKVSYSDVHSLFLPYFELLRIMDRTLYDMLEYRYPTDLKFLVNTYPDFMEAAKKQLFGEQTIRVINAFYALKLDSIRPEKDIRIMPGKNAADTTTTLYSVYTNHDKTLIASYTDKEIYPMTDDQRLSFLSELDALVPPGEIEKQRYYHVGCDTGYYYASDVNKVLYPHVLEGDDAEILQFYNDDLKRYYVTGNYKVFDVYYPRYEEEKEK